MKKSKKRILSTFAFLLMSLIIFAQNTIVNIYPNVKHQVGDISEFDRAKYINLHSTLTDGDWAQQSDKLEYMMSTLDVHLGRDNGIMGSAMNYAKEDALKPGYADSADLVAQGKLVRDGWKLNVRKKYENNSDMMIGGQENPHWPGKVTKSGWTVASSDAVGDFMGRFLNSYYRNDNDPADSGQKRPKYLEVINEPLYGLVDNGEFTPIDVFNHHNAVADAIRRHNKDVKIGGFTLAFPDFDKDNFKNWEERMKLFIDVAGDKMDFFSIHMYDFNKHHFNNGTNFDGPVNFKGSRAEATIDLVENYSKLKLGYVKPLLFSEYGGRDHSTEWLPWTPLRDWQFMKSFSPLMLSLMDRPNLVIKAIPYVMVKAEWGRTNVPMPWRLLRQAKEGAGQTGDDWVFTELVKFYELWSNVKGTRIAINSSNPDLKVDAYVNENKAYVIISNLNLKKQTVSLNMFEKMGLTVSSIKAKHLKLLYLDPIIEETELEGASTEFILGTEATAILEYTFSENVNINQNQNEVKYYAESYLKEIKASLPEVFEIKNLTVSEFSDAVLRVSFGRALDKSRKPIVLFNGTELVVPDNYSGDDQAKRAIVNAGFFGMLEIDVPRNLLKENNTVSINFPDDSGFISTVTMRVFSNTIDLSSGLIILSKPSSKALVTYPNPVKDFVNIKFPTEINQAKLKLYNSTGALMQSEMVSGYDYTMSLKDYSKGVYLLSLENKDLKLYNKIVLN